MGIIITLRLNGLLDAAGVIVNKIVRIGASLLQKTFRAII